MVIDKIALILAIIGALNWGGIGLFGFDTVAFLCGGQMPALSMRWWVSPVCGALRCSSVPMKRPATHRTPPKTKWGAVQQAVPHFVVLILPEAVSPAPRPE